jgi:carboxyl-terminal processing protease
MDLAALEEDLKKLSYDQGKLERYKQWVKSLRTDIYLTEAVQVLNDMVDQKNLVYNSKK